MEQSEARANPLVVDLETRDAKSKRKTDMWFGKVRGAV